MTTCTHPAFLALTRAADALLDAANTAAGADLLDLANDLEAQSRLLSARAERHAREGAFGPLDPSPATLAATTPLAPKDGTFRFAGNTKPVAILDGCGSARIFGCDFFVDSVPAPNSERHVVWSLLDLVLFADGKAGRSFLVRSC